MANGWLIFLPQTPATPSSLRVLVWRRLQQAGALNTGGGAWMLPDTSEHEQLLQHLLEELERQRGSGFLLRAVAFDEAMQTRLIERFQAERDQDYQEFHGRCQDFFAEIAKETAIQKFTFAELEENEQELLKLTRWLRKIQMRDFFPSTSSREAGETLARCRQALHLFTTTVYERAGLPPQSEANDETKNLEDKGKPH